MKQISLFPRPSSFVLRPSSFFPLPSYVLRPSSYILLIFFLFSYTSFFPKAALPGLTSTSEKQAIRMQNILPGSERRS